MSRLATVEFSTQCKNEDCSTEWNLCASTDFLLFVFSIFLFLLFLAHFFPPHCK